MSKATSPATQLKPQGKTLGKRIIEHSIIAAAAPMLIIYPFVQKYFEQGFMSGAVKG